MHNLNVFVPVCCFACKNLLIASDVPLVDPILDHNSLILTACTVTVYGSSPSK